jgi:hypothetical protein
MGRRFASPRTQRSVALGRCRRFDSRHRKIVEKLQEPGNQAPRLPDQDEPQARPAAGSMLRATDPSCARRAWWREPWSTESSRTLRQEARATLGTDQPRPAAQAHRPHWKDRLVRPCRETCARAGFSGRVHWKSRTSQFVDRSRKSEATLPSKLGYLADDVVIEIDRRPHDAIVRDNVIQAELNFPTTAEFWAFGPPVVRWNFRPPRSPSSPEASSEITPLPTRAEHLAPGRVHEAVPLVRASEDATSKALR